MMQHKGYTGIAEFDDEADIFHGVVIGIKDVVTFQGKSVKELRKAFLESVDAYLEYCQRRGEQPDKPFSGKLNLRLSPELHKKASVAAKKHGKSLNTFITESIEKMVV